MLFIKTKDFSDISIDRERGRSLPLHSYRLAESPSAPMAVAAAPQSTVTIPTTNTTMERPLFTLHAPPFPNYFLRF